MPHSIALSIFIENTKSRNRIRFVAPHINPLVIPLDNRMTLGNETQRFRKYVRQFKDVVRNAGPVGDVKDVTAVGKALLTLYKRGQSMTVSLFSPHHYKVQDFFRQAYWSAQANRAILPFIEVHSLLEDFIPFEFMPLFDMESHRKGLDDEPTIKTPEDLQRVAAYFVGFAMLVKRRVLKTRDPGKNDSEAILRNRTSLPIKVFQHAGLSGAASEVEFFRRNTEFIDLEGPWPNQEYTQEYLENRIAEYLWNPKNRFNGPPSSTPDQIHHFACHCQTHSADSDEHSLILSHTADRSIPITIGALQANFFILGRTDQRKTATDLPLVFLNACEATNIRPETIASFPRLFLKNGNRGVIGTEIQIPDKFAADFSAGFYTYLLEGYSLGEAIHRTRWTLLRDHNDPLGLLYILYANPDMYVLKPKRVHLNNSADRTSGGAT